MRVRTPKLPDPAAIRKEIDALKARIGELRVLLPLAEVQHLRKSLIDPRQIKDVKGARRAEPERRVSEDPPDTPPGSSREGSAHDNK